MGRFFIVIMGALLEWVAGAAAGPPPAPEMANRPNLMDPCMMETEVDEKR